MSKKSLAEVTEEMKEKHPLMTKHVHSINDCAEEILRQMDQNEADYYKNISLETDVPIWQIVASMLRLCCDRADGPAGQFDARWKKEGSDKSEDGKCVMCRNEFKVTRLGQQVCSGSCGTLWEQKKILDAYNAKSPKCVWCGEVFIAENITQIYDDEKCILAHQTEMKIKGIKKGDETPERKERLQPLKIGKK